MVNKKVKVKWMFDTETHLTKGHIYVAFIHPYDKEKAKHTSHKGMIDIFNKQGVVVKNYYYPDDRLFKIIEEEDRVGLEKEIDELFFIGYRNG